MATSIGTERAAQWNLDVRHALFSQDGSWYHRPKEFPGAYFDQHGYLLFRTADEFERCPGLRVGKQVGVPGGISTIPGYVRVTTWDPASPDGDDGVRAEVIQRVLREERDRLYQQALPNWNSPSHRARWGLPLVRAGWGLPLGEYEDLIDWGLVLVKRGKMRGEIALGRVQHGFGEPSPKVCVIHPSLGSDYIARSSVDALLDLPWIEQPTEDTRHDWRGGRPPLPADPKAVQRYVQALPEERLRELTDAITAERLAAKTTRVDLPYPDEVPEGDRHIEGAVKSVTINSYERSPEARRACITEHGCACYVCAFDFEEAYGPDLGRGFIHVHHLIPLSKIKEEYLIDPVKDLIPVCPNCHAMLHKEDPPVDAARLRTVLASNRTR